MKLILALTLSFLSVGVMAEEPILKCTLVDNPMGAAGTILIYGNKHDFNSLTFDFQAGDASNKGKLAGLHLLNRDQFLKEGIAVDVAEEMNIDVAKIAAAEIYVLTANDDGGLMVFSFVDSIGADLGRSLVAGMVGVLPCK